MDNQFIITYVVPCYNIEKQLPRCIESLERQYVEDRSVEFILVNDGSTDGTLKIINQFAKRDPRVVVIDQENQGVCAARNNALKVARGEYVFFLDGDDYLTDDASQKMYEACRDDKPDVVLFNNLKVYEGKPESAKIWIDYSKFIDAGTYSTCDFIKKTKRIPISFKLYKLQLLKIHQITFDEHLRVGEVYSFFIHCLTLAKTVGVSYAPVMYYLKRKGESATTSINVERELSVIDTLHTINQYVDRNSPELKGKRAFQSPLFFLITSFYLIKYVGRTNYSTELGKLMRIVKKDKEYKQLLNNLTGSGFTYDRYTLIAFVIKFLPAKYAYKILRYYYKYATRNREE